MELRSKAQIPKLLNIVNVVPNSRAIMT